MSHEPKNGSEEKPDLLAPDYDEDYDPERQCDPDTAWEDFRILTRGATFEGPARIEWATNDDLDHSYPTEYAEASYEYSSVWEAVQFAHGGSHVGYAGKVIRVWIDGSLVEDNGYYHDGSTGKRYYYVYCEWPRKVVTQ